MYSGYHGRRHNTAKFTRQIKIQNKTATAKHCSQKNNEKNPFET